jgi:hypothetical protein
MRISDIKTFLVHLGVGKNLLFVKVSCGIHGQENDMPNQTETQSWRAILRRWP